MRSIRRIVTTVSAQFNDLVDQIENNEAVAETALKDFRLRLRDAKVQSRFLQKEINRLNSQIDHADSERELWTGRARRYADSDRKKAIECLRRVRQWDSEILTLKNNQKTVSESKAELSKKIEMVEKQYSDLQMQYRTYLSRAKAADLEKKFTYSENTIEPIADVFDRWEKKIIQKEVTCEMNSEVQIESVDSLADECGTEEEDQALEMALDELIQTDRQ